jgi:hypothetical protein
MATAAMGGLVAVRPTYCARAMNGRLANGGAIARSWRLRLAGAAMSFSLALAIAGVPWAGGAIALPPEDIDRKLEAVPIFVVTDRDGNPVPVAVVDRQGVEQAVLRGFADPEDAIAFLERVRGAEDSGTPDEALVTSPVSLAGLFLLSRQDGVGYRVQLVPDDLALRAARVLTERSGQDPSQVSGLPLFLLTAGPDDDRTYVVTEDDQGQESIRFYMDADMAMDGVEAFQRAVPELGGTVRIEVLTLEDLLKELVEREDDWLRQVEIVPSAAAIAALEAAQEP